jgi:hypothetical protein
MAESLLRTILKPLLSRGSDFPRKPLSAREIDVLATLSPGCGPQIGIDAGCRHIVDLLLAGNSGIQAAMQLGIEPKRVYRAIEWLKRCWNSAGVAEMASELKNTK